MTTQKIYHWDSPEIIPLLELSFDWTEETPGEMEITRFIDSCYVATRFNGSLLTYDACFHGRWLPWRELMDVAERWSIPTANYVGAATISQIIRALDDGIQSAYADGAVTAVVGRPAVAERDFIVRIGIEDIS